MVNLYSRTTMIRRVTCVESSTTRAAVEPPTASPRSRSATHCVLGRSLLCQRPAAVPLRSRREFAVSSLQFPRAELPSWDGIKKFLPIYISKILREKNCSKFKRELYRWRDANQLPRDPTWKGQLARCGLGDKVEDRQIFSEPTKNHAREKKIF